MSIATKQQECLQPFRNQNNEQLLNTIPKAERQQQWHGEKSIDNIVKSEKHVTKPKQLARQTPVVGIELETEIKNVPQGEGGKAEKELKDILDDIYDEDDYIEQQDYQIYQDGQVNEFFNEEILGPKSISDICLVNDHYILVKMPVDRKPTLQPDVKNHSAENAFRELDPKAQGDSSQIDNRKLYRYLRTKRNRITRIAPINEEPEDSLQSEGESLKQHSKLHCLKVQSCWKASEEDVEIYHTQTKIKKSPQKHLYASPINTQKSLSFSENTNNMPEDLEHPQEIQTISGSILKSSLQHQVSLHNYGCLKYNANNNNNNNNILEIGHARKSFPPPLSPPRRKCPRFESLYWLLRPFRGKYRKPKPKIQAVVYKTYFVKWSKPPDTLTHGYGVKTAKLSELDVSVLRRCRSAIF